jgi:hypothetical protein
MRELLAPTLKNGIDARDRYMNGFKQGKSLWTLVDVESQADLRQCAGTN